MGIYGGWHSVGTQGGLPHEDHMLPMWKRSRFKTLLYREYIFILKNKAFWKKVHQNVNAKLFLGDGCKKKKTLKYFLKLYFWVAGLKNYSEHAWVLIVIKSPVSSFPFWMGKKNLYLSRFITCASTRKLHVTLYSVWFDRVNTWRCWLCASPWSPAFVARMNKAQPLHTDSSGCLSHHFPCSWTSHISCFNISNCIKLSSISSWELSVLIKTHAGVKYLVWSQFLSPDITLLRLLQHMGPLTP